MSVDAYRCGAEWIKSGRLNLGKPLALLWVLADHHNRDNGRCTPSYETLGRELDVAERTLRGYLAELRASGIVAVYRTKLDRGRGWGGNAYIFRPCHGGKVKPKEWVPAGSRLVRDQPAGTKPVEAVSTSGTVPARRSGGSTGKDHVEPVPVQPATRPAHNQKGIGGATPSAPSPATDEAVADNDHGNDFHVGQGSEPRRQSSPSPPSESVAGPGDGAGSTRSGVEPVHLRPGSLSRYELAALIEHPPDITRRFSPRQPSSIV